MRLIAVFILLTSLVFGYTINVNESAQERTATDTTETNISTQKQIQTAFEELGDENITDTNYTQNSEADTTNQKQNIFISYKETPQKIFVGQQFSVKVRSIVATNDFDEMKNRVVPQENIVVLNSDENWTKTSDAIYEKTFYLRAKENNATFPQIFLELYKDGNLTSSQEFPPLELNIINLHTDKYYSDVIASWLDVLKVKTTKFDETNLMVVLEIVAKNANLKDFNLSYVTRGGIDSYVDNFPVSRIYYYAIVPNHTDKLIFKYFNIKQNRFIKKSVNLVLSDEEISTQSDLNPQDSSFNLYKNITYGTVALILLLIYIKRKRVVYLLFFIILAVLFFLGINPLSSIKIAKNSKVYILPMKNSTIFYVTPQIIEAQKLNTREDYIKVILPDKKIGWIKEKNVIND
jgi:hypothetical protein